MTLCPHCITCLILAASGYAVALWTWLRSSVRRESAWDRLLRELGWIDESLGDQAERIAKERR